MLRPAGEESEEPWRVLPHRAHARAADCPAFRRYAEAGQTAAPEKRLTPSVSSRFTPLRCATALDLSARALAAALHFVPQLESGGDRQDPADPDK